MTCKCYTTNCCKGSKSRGGRSESWSLCTVSADFLYHFVQLCSKCCALQRPWRLEFLQLVSTLLNKNKCKIHKRPSGSHISIPNRPGKQARPSWQTQSPPGLIWKKLTFPRAGAEASYPVACFHWLTLCFKHTFVFRGWGRRYFLHQRQKQKCVLRSSLGPVE